MVELAAAVVRDVDDVDAVIERDARVLVRCYTLQDQRDLVSLPDASDVIPVERRLRAYGDPAHLRPPGLGELVVEVALAAAVVGGVDREAESRHSGLDRRLDVVLDEAAGFPHVELEYGSRTSRLADFGLGARGNRAQHLRHAELAGSPRHRERALGIESLEPADRGEQHRQAQLVAEEGRRGVDLGDVVQDAWPQRD